METDIRFSIKSIDDYYIKPKLKGFYFDYKKKSYFVSVNHNFAIDSITINGSTRKNFTNCLWNEIIYFEINSTKNQFVFKDVRKKQIDSRMIYKFNSTGRLKFISNEFLPVGMMPNNPLNLYYKMEIISGNLEKGKSGSPVYDKDLKLIGIISKIEARITYVIPIIYLIKSLCKINNKKIYTINEIENIKYINKYKVNSNKVYCNFMNNYLPLDCYINLISDKSKKIIVKLSDKIEKQIKFNILKNNILNSFEYLIYNDKIKLTSSILRYFKEIIEDQIIRNIYNIFNQKEFFIILNNKKFVITY